jgi:hypothetical protein
MSTRHNSMGLADTVGMAIQTERLGKVKVVTRYLAGVTSGWVALLVRASQCTPDNRVYDRRYEVAELVQGDIGFGHNVFWLEKNGIYEAEHDSNGKAFRTVFEVKEGEVTWVRSVTYQKRLAMLKVREALAGR